MPQSPARRRIRWPPLDMLVERFEALAQGKDAIDIYLHDEVLSRLLELDLLHPAVVRLGPVALAARAQGDSATRMLRVVAWTAVASALYLRELESDHAALPVRRLEPIPQSALQHGAGGRATKHRVGPS